MTKSESYWCVHRRGKKKAKAETTLANTTKNKAIFFDFFLIKRLIFKGDAINQIPLTEFFVLFSDIRKWAISHHTACCLHQTLSQNLQNIVLLLKTACSCLNGLWTREEGAGGGGGGNRG